MKLGNIHYFLGVGLIERGLDKFLGLEGELIREGGSIER